MINQFKIFIHTKLNSNLFHKNLASRAGLQQKDVLEVLELTSMASPLILEKGNGKFKVTHLLFKEKFFCFLNSKTDFSNLLLNLFFLIR